MRNYHMIIRILFTLIVLSWAMMITVPASAAELVVTRYFSGLWDQPKQESQGIMLQIIDQEEDGKKKAVAYWFTYGDDLKTAWIMAIGHVEGDQVVMKLYTVEGVDFMEDDAPGTADVQSVGSLLLSFHNCNKGLAQYDTETDIGSGEFEIKKLAGLYNSRCSGGISDDTPSNAKPIKLDVDLLPARDGITGKGKAMFWERVDRSDFHVSAEGIADDVYALYVCAGAEPVGFMTVTGGEGSIQFRSPEAEGKENLFFDPRDCLIELHDAGGAVLTSGDAVLAEMNNGNSGGGNNGNGKKEIEVDLDNNGIYPDAEGAASYLEKNNSVEFEVEIKGVPAGNYPLWVESFRGDIVVAADDEDDGTFKGKLRFSNPQKEERELLNFDPRGKLVEVYEGVIPIFEVFFPE